MTGTHGVVCVYASAVCQLCVCVCEGERGRERCKEDGKLEKKQEREEKV